MVSAIFTRVVAIGLLACLAACSDEPRNVAPAQVNTTPAQTVSLTPRQSQMWTRSCALCHVDGTAGAPRLGHADEWADRINKGQAVLLAHTLEGLNDMPPLGYCMACEADDFTAMISFMSGSVLSGGDL